MKINNLYSPSAVFITQTLVELSKQLKQIIQIEHTPNANMADHSVGARDELHESEASEALMFCFDNASQKVLLCRRSGLFYLAVATSCCVSELHEKGYKFSTVRLLSLGKIVDQSNSLRRRKGVHDRRRN